MGKNRYCWVPVLFGLYQNNSSVLFEYFASTENKVSVSFGSHILCFQFGSGRFIAVRKFEGFNFSSVTAQTVTYDQNRNCKKLVSLSKKT